MSYLVLARRWRPQLFSDLVGQDVVVRTLKNALASGNLAHAYLLCGIRGVGKTTIARLMAMAANCEQPEDGEPCGRCKACRGIADGSNLDVQEMDAASHTGVDDVREILDGVRYPPSSLKTRVYIIDEAHMLSKSAFNALLKTLEEPPAHVLFILATTESEKLPVTVRSRCQRFDLRRLGLSEIAAYLTHVFEQESISADSDAVAAIARAADGSVRDALSLSERVLAYSGKKLALADVDAALGQIGVARIRSLSHAIFAGDALAVVEQMRTAAGTGHGARTLLQELARLWHQLSCLLVDESLLGEEVDLEQRQWLEQYRDKLSGPALDLRYQVLISGMRDLSLVDERMGAEMILMRLCGLNAISAVGALPAGNAPLPAAASATGNETIAAKAAVSDSGQAEASAPAPSAEADLPLKDAAGANSAAEMSNQPAGQRCKDWPQVVAVLHEFKPGLAAMLEHVQCLEFSAKVRLALDKHQQAMINASDRRAFAEWLGREVFWESRQAGEGESISQERERLARAEKARMRQHAEADPHLQALMQEMDAQLVNVLPAGVADESAEQG
ncbi:DNA polymerase III subunit gamma/tau [Mariprofundus ferrooxydans]|uniref:DNA polymerase III subunit gamma/tau n=1 Tax=Mariprofundus ferrooxydans TaxID=314344 RepID=UPI0014313F73|nr:DNA polymerase III subunit gamma/tau [Mariprofundus ferrooxydans]